MQLQFLALVATALGAASASSPTNGYAPGKIDCPDVDSLIRPAGSLNSNESDYVQQRWSTEAKPALIDFLGRANLTDFDAASFLSNTTVRIGMAFSGGGYRAMLAGAGQFAALDNRTINSTDPHHMGGLVQASTYLAGLSGGNWLVGSIIYNNFTTISALQGDPNLWNLEHSLLDPSGINIFGDASYWDDIDDDVNDKQNAGFNTSLTDIWGRGLSHQFVNLTNGGPALTYDDIRDYVVFKSHQMPFPVIVTDNRAPDTVILSTNSSVFEMSPYELGSWDPDVYAFTDVKYLGTNVTNGKPNGTCIAGFDNAGFVMGTSSSLFNQFILQINSTGISGLIGSLAQDLLHDLGQDNDDIAIYDPNPFAGVATVSESLQDSAYLTLVDGGEDNQNVPLYPLIQPERKVDVVFAFDNSADTNYSWPNGSSLVNSYERQFGSQGNNTIFPYVPDTNTFINLGLTKRPTFFGCDASNLTSLYNPNQPESEHFVPPLIVYVANFAHSFFSNTSTFQLSYSQEDLAGMITNGYDTATQQNGTIDADWPTCVSCAIIQRELERRGQSPSSQCQSCFSKYCWNGDVDAATVNTTGPNFDPTLNVSTASPSASATAHKKSDAPSHWTPSILTVAASLLAAAAFIL